MKVKIEIKTKAKQKKKDVAGLYLNVIFDREEKSIDFDELLRDFVQFRRPDDDLRPRSAEG